MATPAWKMAADLSEGYVTLNPVSLKKYERHEVDALAVELTAHEPSDAAEATHNYMIANLRQSSFHLSLFPVAGYLAADHRADDLFHVVRLIRVGRDSGVQLFIFTVPWVLRRADRRVFHIVGRNERQQ